MGVPSKVFDCVSEAVKGFLDVRAPVFFIKGIAEFIPFIRIPELFTGRRKHQLTAFIKGIQGSKVFPLEFIPEDLYGDEKMIFGFTDFIIRCKPAAGNDTVHMHMIEHFLVPGMKDLYDAGSCAEILFIRGEFQKGVGGASVEQSIEELLVTVEETVQVMWKSKDHMEIGRVDYFLPALIGPELVIDGLAAGAVPVAAGIVVECYMAAVWALGNIYPKFSRFTVEDREGSFSLDV